MGNKSRSNRADQNASKINHSHFINDESLKRLLKNIKLPKNNSHYFTSNVYKLKKVDNEIEQIFAFDGGYTEGDIENGYIGAKFAFFQIGALWMQRSNIQSISKKQFIDPNDINKLKNLDRYSLAIPSFNVIIKDEDSFTGSFRKLIYDFFMKKMIHDENFSTSLIETLKWLVFEEYKLKNERSNSYILASHPEDSNIKNITLNIEEMDEDYIFHHPSGDIYLTDIFRLHECISDEHGANGALGYITRLIEQFLMIHHIKLFYLLPNPWSREEAKNLIEQLIFIIDGPLSFSGPTANMHKIFRSFINFLWKKDEKNQRIFLNIIGIEKSGFFVEHAKKILSQENYVHSFKLINGSILKNSKYYKNRKILFLLPGEFMLLSDDYIKENIQYQKDIYGGTSYYGGKVIFRSNENQLLVVSVPIESAAVIKQPKIENYLSLEKCLNILSEVRCSIYDDAIIPVVLADKLVSLANRPSQKYLTKFLNMYKKFNKQ